MPSVARPRLAVRTGPRDLTGWQPMCSVNEIRPGRVRSFLIDGTEIALCRDSAGSGATDSIDSVAAVGSHCVRCDAPLNDATVENGLLYCSLHDCVYDLRSGTSPTHPDDRLAVYPARIRGDHIEINVDAVPPGPGIPDNYLGRWARRRGTAPDLAYVHALADGRSTAAELSTVPPPRAHRPLFAAQLARPVIGPDDPVDLAVVLGTRAQRPLRLAMPLMVGHISYGTVSIEAKVALARGAREAGTAIGSGDGGIHGRERDAAEHYVVQLRPGHYPDPTTLGEADAIELRFGEAGRPGYGPTLLTHQVTTELSLHREIPPGVDYHASPMSPSWTIEQLAADIRWLRAAADGVPIGVKLIAGDLAHDLPIAVSAGVDFVTIETADAGISSAEGTELRTAFAVNPDTALRQARAILDEIAPDVQLIAAGGCRRVGDAVRMLAVGVDAIALGTSALWAIGCQDYRGCSSGSCPVGIATQDPSLRLRLNPDISGRRLASYLRAMAAGVADHCRAAGCHTPAELRTRLAP